ncbi:hypothetical protein [uncultured Cohaesibacter sp.]|uniref:hypothetical protein n=1 Tax=uncultured Cohaesibacter sp. TaxID=1002546 RepID=UPI0029C6BC4E|nr:hypothetical protein [uncultured Cohaesibacter sp.]
MAEQKILYPITMSMKVAFTSIDGVQIGTATYDFPNSITPTQDEVAAAFAEVEDRLPNGYRVMSRFEHFNMIMKELTGSSMAFAMPALKESEVWHDPATANSISIRDFDDEELEEDGS